LWRTGSAHRARPAMEGTSGAADRAPLRGGTREAALRPVAQAAVPGGLATVVRFGEPTALNGQLQARSAASTRQEVSKPIGLGQSSFGERSPEEESSPAKAVPAPDP
jgi:hypothetical protein